MKFFQNCKRKCLINFVVCIFLIVVSGTFGALSQFYLEADVLKDFIEAYFELDDTNTSKLIKVLVEHRDANKELKKYIEIDEILKGDFKDTLSLSRDAKVQKVEARIKELKDYIEKAQEALEVLEEKSEYYKSIDLTKD